MDSSVFDFNMRSRVTAAATTNSCSPRTAAIGYIRGVYTHTPFKSNIPFNNFVCMRVWRCGCNPVHDRVFSGKLCCDFVEA